jgi:hypothetical protein
LRVVPWPKEASGGNQSIGHGGYPHQP